MNWITAAILACLVTIPSATFGRGSAIASASGLRYSSMPLESLPIVQSDSWSANVISPVQPGHYRGLSLTSGIRLNNGISCNAYAEFHLRHRYDELSGTVYNENTSEESYFSAIDASDPSNTHSLYGTAVSQDGHLRFHARVTGVNYLLLKQDSGCGPLDVVALLSSGTHPPTQVVPRYPTGNAGVPAERTVLFAWNPFPGAKNYAIHIWLVGLSGSEVLTPTTPFSFSGSVYHKTSYTWNNHGFLRGTYRYSLLPLDDSGHNLAGWSTPVQITTAS